MNTDIGVQTDISDEYKLQMLKRRWQNRRYMAWVSITFLVFVGVWSIFLADPVQIQAIQPVLSSIIYATTSIVGIYMGLSTWAEKK